MIFPPIVPIFYIENVLVYDINTWSTLQESNVSASCLYVNPHFTATSVFKWGLPDLKWRSLPARFKMGIPVLKQCPHFRIISKWGPKCDFPD